MKREFRFVNWVCFSISASVSVLMFATGHPVGGSFSAFAALFNLGVVLDGN